MADLTSKHRTLETDARAHQVAALPWRRETDGRLAILLITSRTNGKWMLPKGWPIAGKNDAESARQEAQEEAGVVGIVSETPLGSYHFIRQENDGSTRPSQAIVYSLQVTDELKKWDEKKERTRRWFSPEDAAHHVHERDLARLLSSVAAGRALLT